MKEYSFGIIPVYKENGQRCFLLVRHREDPTLSKGVGRGGHWAFPKGHAQGTEEGVQAAVREFGEETGIEEVDVVSGVSFLEHYTFTRENKNVSKTATYFIGFVRAVEVRIQREEIQDFRWVSYEDALELMTFEEARRVLQKAQLYLTEHE